MRRTTRSIRSESAHFNPGAGRRIPSGIAAMLAAGSALGFDFETGNADIKASWDTTVRYTTAMRTESRSPTLVNRPPATLNQDDGDRNFDTGLISSRVDLFTELDITFRTFGVRASAAGWYDAVYGRPTASDSATTANQFTVASNRFTRATRDIHGSSFEVLDVFAFGRGTLGDLQGM